MLLWEGKPLADSEFGPNFVVFEQISGRLFGKLSGHENFRKIKKNTKEDPKPFFENSPKKPYMLLWAVCCYGRYVVMDGGGVYFV